MRFGQTRHQRRFLRHIVLRIGRIPNQRAARFELGSHFGAHMFDRLKAGNGSIELLAGFGIVDGFFQHHRRRAETVSSQQHAACINHLALRFGMIIARHRMRRRAIEVERHGLARLVDHGQCGLRDTLCAAFHHHQLITCGEQKMRGVFSPHYKCGATRNFIAVQRQPGAFAPTRRLSHADTHNDSARSDLRQPVFIARSREADNRHAVSGGETRRRDMAAQLLLNQSRFQHTHAKPAQFLTVKRFRQQHIGRTQFHQPVLQCGGEARVTIGKAAHRFQFRRAFEITPHRILQHGLVF